MTSTNRRWSDEELSKFHEEFLLHQKHEEVSIHEVIETLERNTEMINSILDAFPDGDVRRHREYHDQLIATAKEQQDFWRDLKLDLAKKGLWSVLIIVTGLIVTGLATKLGITK